MPFNIDAAKVYFTVWIVVVQFVHVHSLVDCIKCHKKNQTVCQNHLQKHKCVYSGMYIFLLYVYFWLCCKVAQ